MRRLSAPVMSSDEAAPPQIGASISALIMPGRGLVRSSSMDSVSRWLSGMCPASTRAMSGESGAVDTVACAGSQ
jgi:hypothetical protein